MRTPLENETACFQGLWPTFDAFAGDAGVKSGTAQVWRHRNAIPRHAFSTIAFNGAKRGIGEGKTHDKRFVYLMRELEALAEVAA